LPRSLVQSTSTNPRSGEAGANRAFIRRTVAYLAAEGVRQFLDIGTGIPTKPNLHEVVQDIAPDARIVYADNDPVVLAHARALLVGTPEGTTSYLQADLRNPGIILQIPHAALAVMYGVHRSTVTRAVRQVRPLLAGRGYATPAWPAAAYPGRRVRLRRRPRHRAAPGRQRGPGPPSERGPARPARVRVRQEEAEHAAASLRKTSRETYFDVRGIL
jgi:S-adenosyl methyltransferase